MIIYLFGCKDTTLHVARSLMKDGLKINLITISPKVARKNDIAGYENLYRYKGEFNSVRKLNSYSITDKSDIKFFEDNKFKLAFCVGWQRLIPPNVLKKFSLGVHGMHGSARDLPYGKGRSPMNWSIIEGRKWFSTNLFKYDEGIDSGPIVDTITFSINDTDTAETLHYKNTISMCSIIRNNIDLFIKNKIIYKKQKSNKYGTYFPKRVPEDGAIDWRDDIFNIDRLIRAVSPPFYGAITKKNKIEIRIFRASIFYTDIEKHQFINSLFGEVVEKFPNGKILVRCSGGVILLHEFDGLEVNKGDIFDQTTSPFKKFKRNIYGYFDN